MRLSAIFAGVAFVFASCSTAATVPDATPNPTQTATPRSTKPTTVTDPELEAGLDAVIAAGYPGGVLYAQRGDGTTFIAARGVAEAALFNIASVTKVYVATIILQLAQEGRLSLDDAVERWLPGVLPYGESVTVRELLRHTSGMPDYLDEGTPDILTGCIEGDRCDVGAFIRALIKGDLLSDASRAEMFDGVATGDGVTYGLGISLPNGNDSVWVGHTGATHGYESFAALNRETGAVVVLLLNGAELDEGAADAATHVVDQAKAWANGRIRTGSAEIALDNRTDIVDEAVPIDTG